MTYVEVPVPDDMKEDVDYWRAQLIEAVAEYDDKLMEKFFENPRFYF
jgi:elongation factor G